jgi:hypothetical protein
MEGSLLPPERSLRTAVAVAGIILGADKGRVPTITGSVVGQLPKSRDMGLLTRRFRKLGITLSVPRLGGVECKLLGLLLV